MRKILKNENGLTLIALIISVIIMLILAGVAISRITIESGLFGRTQTVINTYEKASKKEANMINDIINDITKYENIVYIYTKEDLENFKSDVNSGNTYEGVTVKLMDNIDLGGNENDNSTWWTPIGGVEDVRNVFSGTFDGNNHEIKGIYNNVETTSKIAEHGFFSLLSNGAIKNLTLEGDIILAGNDENEANNFAAGAFACGVDGKCLIIDCVNKVNLTKKSIARDVAGFVGALHSGSELTIKNCINYGNMSGSNNCGGFVGNVHFGQKLTIEDSCNKGSITNYLGNYAGGLIARDDSAVNSTIIIKNSYNEGTIRARSDTGGLVGRIYNDIVIDNSYNIGEIYSEQKISNRCVGGLIGKIWHENGTCTIINSYNSGNLIIAEEEYGTNVGGLIGETRTINTYVLNSYNSGNISGSGTYVSGICGYVYAPSNTAPIINMNNCYNRGEVLGQNTAGITIISNSQVVVNIDKVYYLNSISNVGVLDLAKETDIQNPIYDIATSLSEKEMKAQEFVAELNKNLLDINIQYNLRKWKYIAESYPKFE